MMGSIRRARELSDIAPQHVAKSGLSNVSELDSSKWGSIRIQHVTGLSNVSEGKSRFPKLDECAHFHYEHVELGPLKVSIADDENLKPLSNEPEEGKWWSLSVESQGKTWLIRRSYENFRMLDQQLHRCIYDRKFSELTELPAESIEDKENIQKLLSDYVKRFSIIAGNLINCGPILNWLELDNRGHRLLVPDNDNCPINTPAVAAAYSVKRYAAQAPDEISFEVGDMISVIDMPPPEESIWWHGKKGFQVGFFPCECVAVIGDKVPRNLHFSPLSSQPTKPVLRKHGKLIAFFRSFILSRPSRRRLKQSGILRERVFGCDLGEHLLNSGHEIPMVLKCCVEFIETHGLVDGIYRLSGVTSNIQKLRNAFDEDRVPGLYEDEAILQDVHSVASLLKMYFRELPNPLCTYQLYHQFVGAVQATQGDDSRLLKMRDVVQKLPPPHYRTLKYLMRHLARVSEKGNETGMTSRNVAIVWAPNLLRCKELEVGGVAALQGVGVQAVVTEFLICYAELIFCDRLPNFSLPTQQVSAKKCRPKSLAISTPTKLLSLEEARNRALLQSSGKPDSGYIEVGGGPASLPAKYHTVIELPGYSRKRMESKRSPLGWKSLFGKSGRSSQRKHMENKTHASSDITIIPGRAITESDLAHSRRHLRPAKSAESLSSGLNSDIHDLGDIKTREVGSVEDTLGPIMLRTCEGKSNGHNRSISHDSYFDQLQDQNETVDISEIEVNFDLEDSEMRIFSEDETLISTGSNSLASNGSPLVLSSQKLIKGSSAKRLSYPKLTSSENGFDNTQNSDPSPKKQKTNDEEPARSKLEERLSSSVGDIQFIDSVSPDQGLDQGDVHPIQSPSPVSSISQLSSALVPASPILPHIPHLMKSLPEALVETQKIRLSLTDDSSSKRCDKSDDLSMFAEAKSIRPHSAGLLNANSYLFVTSDGDCAVVSDKESLQSSDLTTPETPNCSTYTPFVNFEDSSLSNKTTPDVDCENIEKPVAFKNFESINSSVFLGNSETAKNEVFEVKGEKLSENVELTAAVATAKPHLETITPDMVKLDKLRAETVPPKPEERKPKPVHPYENVPFVNSEMESGRLLETSFDGEPVTWNRSVNIGYEIISTESSSDSLIQENQKEENGSPTNCESNGESSPQENRLRFEKSRVIMPEKCSLEEKTHEKSLEENFETDDCLRRLFDNEKTSDEFKEEKENSLWNTIQDEGARTFCPNSFKNHNLNYSILNASGEKEESEKLEVPEAQDSSGSREEELVVNICEDRREVAKNEENEKFEAFKEHDPLENYGDKSVFSLCDDGTEVTEVYKEPDASSFENEKLEEILNEQIQNESIVVPAGETNEKPLEAFDNYLGNFEPPARTKGFLETDLDDLGDFFSVGDFELTTEDGAKEVEEMFLPSNTFFFHNCGSLERESKPLCGIDSPLEILHGEPASLQNSILAEEAKEMVFSAKEGCAFKERSEERPKTLERLSTRRKTERDSTEASIDKVQLGKSKSGSHINEKSPDSERMDVLSSCEFDLSDPGRRERIEKYKEKRRNYLREKYRSDSFKNDKDDFVLKLKQRHLRKSEWIEDGGRDGDSSSRSSEIKARDRRASETSREKISGTRLRRGSDSTVKDSLRKSFSAEVTEKMPRDIGSLKENRFERGGGGGEPMALSEVKSVRSSPEKKNHFLNFGLAGSVKACGEAQHSAPRNPFRKAAEYTRRFEYSGMDEASRSAAQESTVKRIINDSTESESQARTQALSQAPSQAPSQTICIKDMAALFESRGDSKPAKQYLSSV